MTKTIIIGEQKESEPEKKKIELKFMVDIDREGRVNSEEPEDVASEWSFVELICKNYYNQWDLIFCYDDANCRESGLLYIGQWNDGVA